ncbi:MAG: hypothetical protein WCK32_00730 [Chlorobiaceae bacterium]
MANELFELLVKITGDTSIAQGDLEALKAKAAELDSQLSGMDVGSKAFEETTTKAKLYGRAINELEQPVQRLSGSNKAAQNTALNLNRVIQDMPYGIMGVANNVDVFAESWTRLAQKEGGAKAAVQALTAAFTGPSGIMMAISAATALWIAFGPKIVSAMSAGGESVDNLKKRLEAVKDYTSIDIAIKIHGSSGLEKLKYEMDQLIAKMNYLNGEKTRSDERKKATPNFGDVVKAGLSSDLGTAGAYENLNALEAKYRKADILTAKKIYAGKLTLGAEEDIRFMTEYLKMSEFDAKNQQEKNDIALKMQYNLSDQKKEEIKNTKKSAAESKRLASERTALEKKLEEEQKALMKQYVEDEKNIDEQTSTLYSSMISDVEGMVVKTKDDFTAAITKLHSGALGERYDALVKQIDESIQTSLTDQVKSQLEAIKKKLMEGKALSNENAKFLENAGFTKGEASNLLEFSKVPQTLQNAEYKAGKVKGDGIKHRNNPETLTDLSKDYQKDLDQFAEGFNKTLTNAFDGSVDLFSASLASAIIQGGQSLGDVLSSVAKSFEQMMLEYMLRLAAEAAATSILNFIGLGGFAEGSPFAPPGYAWVGEKGPELVRMKGGEEIVPYNQVNQRLNALYQAGASAQMANQIFDTQGIISALNKQTKSLIDDRLNYEITMNGMSQIAKATKAKEAQIRRLTGQ